VNGNEVLRKRRLLAKSMGLGVTVESRGKGSHRTITFGDRKAIIRHLPDELKTGTLKAMCDQLGIRKEEL
jgi:mRNA interferase HicA